MVSTHSRPKAAGYGRYAWQTFYSVSTHSRPKAAGSINFSDFSLREFQHTAARRRLGEYGATYGQEDLVSTHSRPKAAGCSCKGRRAGFVVSTHSRPKAAGLRQKLTKKERDVSTHSRPKAAGCRLRQSLEVLGCFNTQPPEGGWSSSS